MEIPSSIRSAMPEELIAPVTDILANDPRPAYQEDSSREYGFLIWDYEIKFKVDGDVLTVCGVTCSAGKNNGGSNA